MSGRSDPAGIAPAARRRGWGGWARPALVVYWVALAVGTHWPGLDLGAVARPGIFELDKAVHGLAFAGLAWLMIGARPLGRWGRGTLWAALVGAGIAALYAAGDEWSQPWFARTASLADLTADLIGILGVFLVAATPRPTLARSGWFVWPMRLAWLVIGPALVVLALMETMDHEYFRVLRWLGVHGPHADKAGHFAAAMIVTWLMAAAVPLGRRRARASVLLTVATMAALAPMIEWTQSLVGRDSEIGDVIAHEHGLLLALSVWAGLVVVVRGRGLWIALGRAALGMNPRPPRKPEPREPEPPEPREPDRGDGQVVGEIGPIAEAADAPAQGPGEPGRATPAEAEDQGPEPAGDRGEAEGEKSFVGDAAVVGGLTLISRFTGLARDAVLAGALGLTGVSDAFFLGFLVPNLFRRLFGEGALSAAFIPQYARLRQRDAELARRFASLCVVTLAVGLAGVTLVGELGLWAWQVWAMHAAAASAHAGARLSGGQPPGVDRGALAVRLTMVMLPFMPMICVVALLGGVLQVHRKFGPPAAAPIALNLAMIGFALYGAWTAAAGEAGQAHTAMWVAGGVLVAGAVQVLWQFAAAEHNAHLSPVGMFKETWPSARRMLAVMGPMVIGLSVFQFNALLDTLIAMGLSASDHGRQTFTLWGHAIHYPMRFGDVAALSWAQRLYQFPLGVFAVAIATAIFPALAAAAGKGAAMPEPAVGRAAGAQAQQEHAEHPEQAEQAGENRGENKTPDAPGDQPRAAPGAGSPEEENPGNAQGDGFAGILREGLGLTVFLGLPASVGLVLVRQPLTRVVYERYAFDAADAARVAAILGGYAVSIWAYSLTQVLTRAFYAAQDAVTPVRVSVAMVTVNLALNLTLIWPLGAAGLAWSTAISAAGQAALLLWLVRRHVDRPVDRYVLASWGRSAIAAALMGAALAPIAWWADFPHAPWTTAAAGLAGMVLLGAGVVLAVAWLTGAPELARLRRRVRRR